MSFLDLLFGTPPDRLALAPLYEAIVARARLPVWYREGGVPDTMDGRFDMVTAVLALVLLRLEREGDAAAEQTALLTELFIDDMDATLRELGIGDIVVGKRVGKLLNALAGRMTAWREAFADGGVEAAVRRNVYRGEAPSDAAVALVGARLAELQGALAASEVADLVEGRLP